MKNPFRKRAVPKNSQVAWLITDEAYKTLCVPGYTSLDQCPEIVTGCRKIAQLIGATTIYLRAKTSKGDERIVNELSRAIDINPMPNMTRSTWMEGIVMTLLLYGRGNAIVVPHTWSGNLASLEPIAASRVGFIETSPRDYKVTIDGNEKNPENLLHFVFNPDKNQLWKGQGLTVSLRDLADTLKQASATTKAFMNSEYKPSLIIRVDADDEIFGTPEGREKLIDSYVKPARPGQPWVIPANTFDIEQIKPLSLADLAIADTVKLSKQAVAAILGVPAFVLGVGSYNKDEWNAFIQGTIMPIAKSLAQEMTKKLILSPSWYLEFNVWSLMDYDLSTMSSVLLAGADRGFVNGDEWRDRMHMSPAGLKDYKILENYIPYEDSGKQSKLNNE